MKQKQQNKPRSDKGLGSTGEIRWDVVHGTVISFNTTNQYVNGTEMCTGFAKGESFGKEAYKYLRKVGTKHLIAALANELKVSPDRLVIKQPGWGTWLHPVLALECARWVSPECENWCKKVIKKALCGGMDEASASHVPMTFFKVLKALVAATKEKERLTLENEKLKKAGGFGGWLRRMLAFQI